MTDDELQVALHIIQNRLAAINFVSYCVAAVLGQLACAGRLWLAKEIDCVFDRFRHDPRATLNSVLTNFTAVGLFGFAIPWAQMPLQDVLGIGVMIPVASIMMGLSQGYSADSALNKSARKAWTSAERAQQKAADAP